MLAALCAALSGCNDDDSDDGSHLDATLATLTLSGSELDQVFQSELHDYTATVGFFITPVEIVAIPADPAATVRVDGADPGPDGAATVALIGGANAIEIEVMNGGAREVYTLEITRGSTNSVTQSAYLKPASTPKTFVGGVIAASDDIIVIGVPEDDGNARVSTACR